MTIKKIARTVVRAGARLEQYVMRQALCRALGISFFGTHTAHEEGSVISLFINEDS